LRANKEDASTSAHVNNTQIEGPPVILVYTSFS